MSVALLLLPDFLLIGLGALLRRVRGFEPPFFGGIERLVYFVLFPALLFRSLATSPLGLGDAGRLAMTGLGFTLGGVGLSWLAQPLPHATFAACFQCGFRFNTYIALEIARNPLVLACAAGILWKATALPLPPIVSHVLGLLASAAVPLGLIAVGSGLTLASAGLPLAALAWWHGVKLVAMPALAFALAQLGELAPQERLVAVTMASVPTAPSAYILATQMKADGASVALLISSGTLLAAITMPLWIALVA